MNNIFIEPNHPEPKQQTRKNNNQKHYPLIANSQKDRQKSNLSRAKQEKSPKTLAKPHGQKTNETSGLETNRTDRDAS